MLTARLLILCEVFMNVLSVQEFSFLVAEILSVRKGLDEPSPVGIHDVQSRQNSKIAFVVACVCSSNGMCPAFGIILTFTSSLPVSSFRKAWA
jgi:hypothetical protein